MMNCVTGSIIFSITVILQRLTHCNRQRFIAPIPIAVTGTGNYWLIWLIT